uniref:Uncharacterized protein n=1 Tax=Haematobia irritans TaxID=7368 RepID=A0A1L8EB72_HAEIR
MSGSNKVNCLVGSSIRYIAGRNAIQTSYWRKTSGNRLVKHTRTCEFDPTQKMPMSLRNKRYRDQTFNMTKS